MTLSNSEPSSLLSPPLSSGVRAVVKYSRPNTENVGYQNLSSQFRLDNIVKSYNHQYYKVRTVPLSLEIVFLTLGESPTVTGTPDPGS